MFLKTQKFQLPVKCVHVNMFKRPLPPGFDPVTKRKRKSSPGGKFFRLLDRLGKKKALQYIKDGSFDQVSRRFVTANIVVNRVFHKDSYMSLLKSNLTTINFRYFIMGPAYRLQRSPPLRGDPPTHHFQVVTGYGTITTVSITKTPSSPPA